MSDHIEVKNLEESLKFIHWECGREDISDAQIVKNIIDLCNEGLDAELRNAACFGCGEKPCTCADQSQSRDYEALYYELLFQVQNKYQGETRHETAKRYIMEREKPDANAVAESVQCEGKDNG